MTDSVKFLVRALLCSTRRAAMRRGLVRLSVNPLRTTPRIAAQTLVVGARSRWVLLRKQWSPFWEHVSVPESMKYQCDGDCQVSGARAALFDSSRRDASRPCAAECKPLAHDPTNCRADFSRRRALTLGSAAPAVVTVLGTCFDTPKIMKFPCDGKCKVSGARAALFDSSRCDASRARGNESAGYVAT